MKYGYLLLLTCSAAALLLAQAPNAAAPKPAAAKAKRIPPPARIIEFKATPTTSRAGQDVTLVWSTENPNSTTIAPQVGRVTPRGTRIVKPTATTTYTLTVTGPNDQTLTETVTVTIPGTTPVTSTAAPELPTATPRLGAHPDLSGVWGGGFGGGGGRGGGRGGAAAPAAGELPTAPTLRAGKDQYKVVRGPTDAGALSDCMPLVGPQAFGVPYQFQLVQNADTVVIFYEYPGIFRIIPTDGTPHPEDPDPTWLGDSVGHWEGDTLVVDAVGFNTRTEVNGFKHSEALHVVEKFTRTNYSTIEYEATMEDPEVFTTPWVAKRTFSLRPDLRRIDEFVCENNKDYSKLFVTPDGK